MITTLSRNIYYSIVATFMALSAVAIALGYWYFLLLPAVVLIAVLGIFRLDILFYLSVAIIPLSINLSETDFGFGFSMPSEPIIFGLMLLIVIKLLLHNTMDKRFIKHPVSIIIIFYLGWMFLTSATSHLPIVSFKYTLARFTFIMVFFYFASELFFKLKNITKFVAAYLILFCVVIIYTTLNHAAAHFTEKAAHNSMTPFYNDHTAYAVLVAMFIPVCIVMIIGKGFSIISRQWSFVALVLLITALLLSYTRAAWVGIAAAIACSLIFIFRISTQLISISAIVAALFLLVNVNTIILNLETNREQSSTDVGAHLQSITNIKTDPSNVERINRWSCAWRMFLKRPITGWGPGTYQFVYGPFQLQKEKTVISTLAGNRGNAHSEYLGPLSEQGVPGTLLFVLLALATLITASRVFIYGNNGNVKIIAAGLILGLITYWVHGFLNNFLDTEKAAVPFFGFIAAIVSLDVFHTKPKNEVVPQL
ncbi:MAG TPA: O-antigen ligase family protein [Bacteroidia bacterium]|nr:O-antigen ligase family protein [Bacteroidia bacterium]